MNPNWIDGKTAIPPKQNKIFPKAEKTSIGQFTINTETGDGGHDFSLSFVVELKWGINPPNFTSFVAFKTTSFSGKPSLISSVAWKGYKMEIF